MNTDYYWPSFAHLGEQAVNVSEVYSNWGDAAGVATMNNVFGYQSRYAEYKYMPDQVAGQFRSTLAYWHLGRIFTAPPNLNITFISSNPRTDIFAVTSDVDHLICQIYHKIDALRPMPYYGTPALV